MLEVMNNNIAITRGDNATLKLNVVNEEGEAFDLTNASVLFRVKKSARAKDILIEKELLQGDIENEMLLKLDEEDTEYMDFSQYRYEIEVVTSDDEHYTVIANAIFEVCIELENHGVLENT